MNRFIACLLLSSLAISPARANDNDGFGPQFTRQTPAALMESPNSVTAQSVPDAASMQNILPAAGAESSGENAVSTTQKPGMNIIKASPSVAHESIESHMTVPAKADR